MENFEEHEHSNDEHEHGDENDHEHEHNHVDVTKISATKLFWVIVLNFGITLAEIIGGIVSGSLSLISDALHNFSDAIAVIISYIAVKLSAKKVSPEHTFGLKRSEILAAFINASVLVGVSCYLFYEAVIKFIQPEEIHGSVMLIVAILGLLGNVLSIFFLGGHSEENMNIKSAYLHMLSDAVSSVAVILGALGIIFFKIYWIDPVLTVIIALYVLRESFKILKRSTHILMQGAPLDISVEVIKEELETIEYIDNVHHIHLWALDEKNIFLEAHVELPEMNLSKTCAIKTKIDEKLKMFRITHCTIQFETSVCNEKNILCS